jgi:trehalose synthase
VYERALAPHADELAALVREGDVVLVHDPQPAGLIEPLKKAGATVIWRCHVGLDLPTDIARGAWRFLIPYVQPADGYVFSRHAFAWEGLEGGKLTVVPPSIDAFSPKNQELNAETVAGILDDAGIIHEARDGSATFVREDGSPGRVDRKVTFVDGGEPPPEGSKLVVQVSRWDRLKDPLGVIRGFADFVAPGADAHLIMAGPAVEAVSDDPEGAEVLEESRRLWETLSADVRPRVHLAALPMDDGEENAAMVNALQRRADVVVQKSLAEGFGLTVSEAMWKARPVVASRIGGIQDQIVDGVSGILIDDATDLESFGNAVADLLSDPERAERIGEEAQRRVRDEFLGARHLLQYVSLIAELIGA